MASTLKDQLQQKDQEIALLHEIARIVNSTVALDELLKKLCDMVARQMKANACLIYLFEEGKDELVLRGANQPHPQQLGRVTLKVGEGVTGWVAEKRKAVAIAKHAADDPRFKPFNNLQEDRYEAFLSVPIMVKSQVIGVLNVHHKKSHAHSPAEVLLAEHISEEIAGAIEHARLIQESQKKAQAIQTLARMSHTISQGAYLQEILQLIVSMTAEMMGSKICSLMLLDDKGKELKIAATQSLSEEYRSKPPVQAKGSVSGRALLEKRAIVVPDVASDPQYAYPDIARKENLRSLLVVPMMIKEKPIGVLNCYTSELHEFSTDEIELLQAVANQAAVAIDHTRAMEQAVAAQEALETRKMVERAKGILMKQQGFTEDAAFRLIQRQAMDRRKSMKEVAEALILSEEIQSKK
jgi:signal transduction protein with GAF and PtsI domain